MIKTQLKFIAALLCLLVGAIFVFVYPNSGVESVVIGILGTIFSYFGINWRKQYSEVKKWIKSKTIWGVILVGIPAIVLLLSYFLNFENFLIFGKNIKEIMLYIIAAGGGTFLIGANSASAKKLKESENEIK